LPPLKQQERIAAELGQLQEMFRGLMTSQKNIEVELDALVPSILDRAFAGEL
jgi:type I restriction enzyme S subunit